MLVAGVVILGIMESHSRGVQGVQGVSLQVDIDSKEIEASVERTIYEYI